MSCFVGQTFHPAIAKEQKNGRLESLPHDHLTPLPMMQQLDFD